MNSVMGFIIFVVHVLANAFATGRTFFEKTLRAINSQLFVIIVMYFSELVQDD